MPLDGTRISPKATILMRALERLRKNGWCKYTCEAADGSMCLGYAILCEYVEYYGGIVSTMGIPYITFKLGLAKSESSNNPVIRFNDKLGTTFEDIEKYLLKKIGKEMALDREEELV